MNYIVETHRCGLSVPQQSDYEHLLCLRTDPEVMRCVGGFGQAFGTGDIQTAEEIKHQLDLTQDYYDKYGFAFFCVFNKETGEFIGQAGLFHWSYNVNQPQIELAYRLHKKYWGRGYATECAIALIEWGFDTHQLPKIMAPVHPGNQRSINVLKKAGMTYQGEVDHKGHLLPNYEITKNERDMRNEIVQHNREGYNTIADTWAKERQWYLEKPSLDQAISHIRPGGTILDVGCGSGKPIAEYLQDAGFEVYGLDISERLIAHAGKVVAADHLFCSDLRSLACDQQFDAIICWFTLFHIHSAEHPRILSKLASMLQPGGILLISFADTSCSPSGDDVNMIDSSTILSSQFSHTFYHSGKPAANNSQSIIDAGLTVIDDYCDQPGNQVIIAKK